MGFPTRVQMIKRGKSRQWVINFPAAIASAMDFSKSETVEWSIVDRNKLELRRIKKKKRSAS
jgi:hypothetical protein